ncbi:hypothetical protein CLV89_102133 [Tritonibacter scottomollicae]|uniref:Uncharacterized protein n=1 Tax=Tritonibacter scottomollicae TaxID=483013 RepID=A0A2T1ALA9_TRISK|nr:hypothetical protein CLV89_102133 [Tritonibacter scottomollicae]
MFLVLLQRRDFFLLTFNIVDIKRISNNLTSNFCFCCRQLRKEWENFVKPNFGEGKYFHTVTFVSVLVNLYSRTQQLVRCQLCRRQNTFDRIKTFHLTFEDTAPLWRDATYGNPERRETLISVVGS